MYFPSLKNLKKRQVSDHDIDIFDWWLATRKPNTRHYLNPLQFSIDCNIDSSYSLELFSYCTYEESISLFSVRYVARCPVCQTVLLKHNNVLNKSKIPKQCYECGSNLAEDIVVDHLDVYFSLLKFPERPLAHTSPPVGVGKDNVQTLQGAQIIEKINGNEVIGKLFSCLN
ncbi:hypothetical protein [Sporosarcina sp. FSL W7-1283]|uniref:hypothetical protein n=1 Tax=Sporosarcina sp. FSL W7-1283 TaxID=2921560 RepID=UPI0030F5BD66